MSSTFGYIDEAATRDFRDTSLEMGPVQSLPPTTGGMASIYSVLGGAGGGAANGSAYAGAMGLMQSLYGNQSVQRYLGYGAGSASAAGGGVSALAFPNNPTPEMDPALDIDWWGDGPLSWGGHIGGALGRSKDVVGGVPMGGEVGFAGGNFGSWQEADGSWRHGWEGEAGLTRAEIGTPGQNWMEGELGSFEGGASFGWDGVDIGGEGALLEGSVGLGGYTLGDLTVGGFESRMGRWDDESGWKQGLKGELSMGKVSLFENTPWLPGVGLEGPSVGGEMTVGESGFNFGAGTNFVSGSLTTGDLSDTSNIDETSRFGLGLGANLGLRGHWDDADGDGQTEYGFGFDAGMFSMDLKSEDPLRTLTSAVMPIPFASPLGFQNPLLPEYNMTNAAVDTFSRGGAALYESGMGVLEGMDPRSFQSLDPSYFLGSASAAGSSLLSSASESFAGLW
jgi:hypothetical protein